MVVSSVAVAQTANSMALTLLVGGVFCHLIFTKALVLSLSQQKLFFFFFFIFGDCFKRQMRSQTLKKNGPTVKKRKKENHLNVETKTTTGFCHKI